MARWISALVFVLGSAVSAFAQAAPAERPALLLPLYVGQVGLHAADLHSTFTALDRGLKEGNPLFSDGNRTRMVGAKIAVGALSILATEKLWKRNRVAAVGVMVGANIGLSYVVARNYKMAAAAR